jgi:uncharacterized protein with beta-barrel porin domain
MSEIFMAARSSSFSPVVRALLASSSVAALLIGGGVPSVLAAPCNNPITAPFDNPSGHVVANVCVENTIFSGNITNEGTISPSGIALVNGTVTGAIRSTGVINGGITIDQMSTVGNAIDISSPTFTGGIMNSGTVSSGGDGILVGVAGTNLTADIRTFSGGITNTGRISAGGNGIAVGGFLDAFMANPLISISTFSGGISNSGKISAFNDGIVVGGVANGGSTGTASIKISNFSGGISNSGTISAGFGFHFGISADQIDGIAVGGFGHGATHAVSVAISTFSGGIANSGVISAAREGIFVGGVLDGGPAFVTISNFSGGITNAGTISAGHNGVFVGGTAPNSSATISTFSGGITNSGIISANDKGIFVGGVGTVEVSVFSGGITNSAGGTINAKTGIVVDAHALNFSGAIANSGTIIGSGGTAIDVSGVHNVITIDQTGGSISGAINLSANADVLNISGGTINGNIVGQGLSDAINFVLGAGTFTYGSNFSGINQVNINSGTVVLNGANTTTKVDVIGGTLAGTGSLGSLLDPTAVTIHSGGALAPGTPGGFGTLSIVGGLAFTSGSFYGVQIAHGTSTSSKTAVTGTASLGGNGTVVVTPQQFGHYATTYQILTTTAGLTGTFAGVTVNGNFVGTATLDYTTNPGNVDLNVSGNVLLATAADANINQQTVLNGLNNGILNGSLNAPLATGFANLGNLSGPVLLNALTQLSGEASTGAERGAFQLTTQFLDLLLDPFAGGRGGVGGGATGFAPETQASLPPDVALAYASVLKAPAAKAPASFDQRWNLWGSAFGGTSKTNGDSVVGSNTVTAGEFGFAVGADYRATPDILVGFALAGGGTNWNLAQGLGGGRSDAFQAGIYGKSTSGPAYVSAALSFANHWFTTNRTALGDRLTATFEGQDYAGRIETGYRYALPVRNASLGITPYAALQTQRLQTPGYSESDLSGGGFGLGYGALSATDTRSELGARFDNLALVGSMPLILRARVAWAHDWVSDPALSAAFQALPGSSFIVNGAALPANSALLTAAAELRINANWSLLAKFDGEFASTSQTYAGTGTLRYTW